MALEKQRVTVQPIVGKGAVTHIADLAVEIKSPDDTYTELRSKAAYYLANGSEMVWLVYPEKLMVEVYRKGSDVDILLESDTIDGGNLLPGFALPVRDIFPTRRGPATGKTRAGLDAW